MSKKQLNKDGEFIVKEEKLLNYVLAALLFALFLYGVIDAIGRPFNKIDYQSYIFALAILPAIYCYKRAHSKRIYIRINKKGIYADGQLITGWANLLNAFITQKEKKGIYDIQDNFMLVVEYRKSGSAQGFRRNILLTNTQNKSEEDVLDAVKFYWKEYKNNPAK